MGFKQNMSQKNPEEHA